MYLLDCQHVYYHYTVYCYTLFYCLCCIVAVEHYAHRQKASHAHSVFQALGALPSHLAVLNIWITLLSFLIIREFTIICVVAGHFCFQVLRGFKISIVQTHIHAYMSCRYTISLSVSTVHTYLKFTLDVYLIPYQFLATTYTHTQEKIKKSSPAPQTTFGTLRPLHVLKGRCKRVGGCGVSSCVGGSPHLKSTTLNLEAHQPVSISSQMTR